MIRKRSKRNIPLENLKQRLQNRGQDKTEVIAERLAGAQEEITGEESSSTEASEGKKEEPVEGEVVEEEKKE